MKTHFEKTGQFSVLSVDDDHVNLLVVEQLLSSTGWKITSAQDGEEALDKVQECWPDFVFLDYQMNVGDSGDEICRKMRKVFGSTPIPIVMCTAMTAGSAALESCKEAGATDYLLKPYERAKMIEKVEQYCRDKVKASKPPGEVAAVASPPPNPSAQPAATTAGQITADSVLQFCIGLDLEYCGQKLVDSGVTMDQLRAMDDAALRKAGVVVKSQRDKILAAVGA